MAFRKRYKKRKSKKEWLKDKVARARSSKTRREWMDKLIAYCSKSYRSGRTAYKYKPRWSFNRKRY